MYSSKKLHKIALSQQRTTKHVLLIWQLWKFEDIITLRYFLSIKFYWSISNDFHNPIPYLPPPCFKPIISNL